MNLNNHNPQASPSLPHSTFPATTNMQLTQTPVYTYMDYPAIASPQLFSSTVPLMPMLSNQIPATPTFGFYLSAESMQPMQELPPGMQSPTAEEQQRPMKAPILQSLPSYERQLRRDESEMSRTRDLRRQHTDLTELSAEYLQRRYSQKSTQKMKREMSLRESMRQRSGASVLDRQKSLTTLQMMRPSRSSSGHSPNIIAMALDKHASLQLQRTIAQAKAYRDFRTIEVLFLQLLPEVIRLSKDAYANFVIQRILEAANPGLVDQMAEYVKLSVLDMSTHKYACRVLQRIVLYSSPKKREELVKSITNEAIELLQNKFGSYVLQTIIENSESDVLEDFTTTHLENSFYELSIDQYGSHIMQHVFRFYHAKDKERLSELVLGRVMDLSNHIHGNYVVQKMVYYGSVEIRSRVIEKILPHVSSLCCTKSGSNVLEKCLQNATREESQEIVAKVVENEKDLQSIISDKYGNYVIQKMLKTLPYEQRIEFSNVLMEYFDKLEEIPEKNSFESFVYRAVVNAKQKIESKNTPH